MNNRFLKSIGLEVQGLIQDSIKNGGWQSNADSTIVAKNGSEPKYFSKEWIMTDEIKDKFSSSFVSQSR